MGVTAEDPGLQEAGGVHPGAGMRLHAHAEAHQAPMRPSRAPASDGERSVPGAVWEHRIEGASH